MSKQDDGFYADLIAEFEELVDDVEIPKDLLEETDTDYCECDNCYDRIMECDGDKPEPETQQFAVTVAMGVEIELVLDAYDLGDAEDLAVSLCDGGVESAVRNADYVCSSAPEIVACWLKDVEEDIAKIQEEG